MSHTASGELSRRQQKVEAGLSQKFTMPMTNGNLAHCSNNHMSCWQEVQNCRDVCGNTKSFNLPYKRRKHGVWFTSQHHHMRIHQRRITAETLECKGAHLSLTLHSLFPLLLFFSLFSTPLQDVHTGVYFWIGQKECMPFPVHAVSICTYEEMHRSNRRVFHEAAITSSSDSQYQTISVSCPLWETLRISIQNNSTN